METNRAIPESLEKRALEFITEWGSIIPWKRKAMIADLYPLLREAALMGHRIAMMGMEESLNENND